MTLSQDWRPGLCCAVPSALSHGWIQRPHPGGFLIPPALRVECSLIADARAVLKSSEMRSMMDVADLW